MCFLTTSLKMILHPVMKAAVQMSERGSSGPSPAIWHAEAAAPSARAHPCLTTAKNEIKKSRVNQCGKFRTKMVKDTYQLLQKFQVLSCILHI